MSEKVYIYLHDVGEGRGQCMSIGFEPENAYREFDSWEEAVAYMKDWAETKRQRRLNRPYYMAPGDLD